MKERLTLALATAVMTAVLAVAAYQLGVIPSYDAELKQLRMREIYDRSDHAFVEQARNRFAKKSGESASRVMEGRYTTVMHVKGDVCVSLNLDPPGVGVVPTYCFDRKSKAVSWADDDGE
ncbi:hypothetical protein RN629_17970 [Sphingomonadaceae bacterium jetA1]|jgi:hypothetical protein|uniref:hypothetical protein n=1 Tax=Facivitalis istanbulensis TaxID=3075838 RepID=UPI003470BEF7